MTRRQLCPLAVGLCLLLGCLTGCADKPPAARVAAQQEAERAADMVAQTRKMQQAFIHLRRIKTAVVAAELAKVQSEAVALGKVPFNQKTRGWAAFADSYSKAASELAKSPDVEAATGNATRMAMTCGGCHATQRVDPGLGIPARPRGTAEPWGEDKKKEDEKIHITVNQWGVDRMWESLVTASDEMWAAGVTGFIDAPVEEIDPNAIPEGAKFEGYIVKEDPKKVPKEKPKEPRSPERQVFVDRLVAATAPLAGGGGPTKPAQRARLLGEILATCAGCHQLPPPPKKDDATK